MIELCYILCYDAIENPNTTAELTATIKIISYPFLTHTKEYILVHNPWELHFSPGYVYKQK